MKKIICFSVMISACYASSFAQKISADKIPLQVKESFEKNYPGTSVKWEREGKNFEAGFTKNRKTMSAVYEPDGELVETEQDIARNELPATVRSSIEKLFNGKKVSETALITKAGGERIYEVEINGQDVLFDGNGSVIKK